MNSAIASFLVTLINGFGFTLAVALTVWLALRMTPQIGAAARHLIWWAALAVGVIVPAVSHLHRAEEPAPPRELPRTAQVNRIQSIAPAAVPTSPTVPAPPAMGAPVRLTSGDWVTAIAIVWGIIVWLQLARIARSYRHLRKLKATARRASLPDQLRFDEWRLACRVQRPVSLLISDRIQSPLAAGFLHPAVILPESLTGELSQTEIDHIMLHELAHMARRDDWTNLAARLAAAAFALHPIAAWIVRRIDREREIACDDWVVRTTGEARSYAQSLARLFELCATRRRMLLATGMAVGRSSQLRERIEVLLRRKNRFRPVSKKRVALLVVAFGILVIGAATAPPWIAFAEQDVTPASVEAAASRGSLLAAIVASGYNELSVDEIIDLKNNGVNAAYMTGLKDSGWPRLTARQIIQLRTHGVQPTYLMRLREAGFASLAVEDVVQLRDNGVTAQELAELNTLGFGPYTVRQMIDLHHNGVRVSLLRSLKDAGFSKVDPREIIEARTHDLRAEHFREAKAYGPNLTLKQIIKLKTAGVI